MRAGLAVAVGVVLVLGLGLPGAVATPPTNAVVLLSVREGGGGRLVYVAALQTLGGAAWTLVGLGGRPLPPDVRPPTAVFAGARLSGFGGCNRYTGQVEEKSPGAIALGTIAATKMACPSPAMEVEDRYFAALGQVTHYRFAGSRLVLSGPSAELIFERATP